MEIDPEVLNAMIQSTVGAWTPVLLSTVKKADKRAKMQKIEPALRTAGTSLITVADAIKADAARLKLRNRRKRTR